MAWAKIDNPKPNYSVASVPPMSVKVKAREAPKRGNRYIQIAVGYALCDKARLLQKEHRVHILVGSGADAGKVAITLDDATGKFKAKRRADGRYEVVVSNLAAAGKFSTTFPPFMQPGSVQMIPGGPPVVVFDAPADFLA